MTGLFDLIGTWFGFVGTCIASPTGACVPFLAFFALGTAAAAALVLLLLAYRSARRERMPRAHFEGMQRMIATVRERLHAIRAAKHPAAA
jgi:hypothetical protein